MTLLGGTSVNDCVYSNQNITERYPWLKFANDMNYKDERESSFKSGKSFNLRKIEKIICLGVKNVINHLMDIEEAIDYINKRLTDIDSAPLQRYNFRSVGQNRCTSCVFPCTMCAVIVAASVLALAFGASLLPPLSFSPARLLP